MKLILLFGLMASFGVQAKNLTNCHIQFGEKNGIRIVLALKGDNHAEKMKLMTIFETSNEFKYAPSFNGFSKWRFVSNDGTIIATGINRDIKLQFKDIKSLNANQFGNKDCTFTGRSAEVLFNTLFNSESTLVTKKNCAVPFIHYKGLL